jgi:hypothetical protein
MGGAAVQTGVVVGEWVEGLHQTQEHGDAQQTKTERSQSLPQAGLSAEQGLVQVSFL